MEWLLALSEQPIYRGRTVLEQIFFEGNGVNLLVGILKGKRPLGRSRRRWEDNIKMHIQEVGWGMDWIDLTQDRDRWRAPVNAVMNLRFP